MKNNNVYNSTKKYYDLLVKRKYKDVVFRAGRNSRPAVRVRELHM